MNRGAGYGGGPPPAQPFQYNPYQQQAPPQQQFHGMQQQMHAQGQPPMHDMPQPPESEYKHMSSALVDPSRAGVTATAFDGFEELIWIGTRTV